MRSRKQTSHLFLEALESRELLSSVPVAAAMGQPVGTREVTVMSQNLYMGADLMPVVSLLAQGRWGEVPAAVSATYQAAQATNFAARAEALAGEIAVARPDIIGLQEVSQWMLIPPTGPQNAQVTDFLAILTTDLKALGLNYTPAVVTENVKVTMPDAQGDYISLTDRNVILVNEDSPGLNVISSSEGHFTAQLAMGTLFNENCSWQAIDVTRGGRVFRYINTHLDTVSGQIQQAQAAELLAGPLATNMPVILGGDFNSDAYQGAYGGEDVTGTYPLLVGSGLTDAWVVTHRNGELGFTWGQNGTLSNPVSTANERIDFFLTHGAIKARSMAVIGDAPFTSGTAPIWVSDHAGILATFQLTANTLHMPGTVAHAKHRPHGMKELLAV